VHKDTLDVYIEHRLMMEARLHQEDDATRDPRNRYPPELLRRLYVEFNIWIIQNIVHVLYKLSELGTFCESSYSYTQKVYCLKHQL